MEYGLIFYMSMASFASAGLLLLIYFFILKNIDKQT